MVSSLNQIEPAGDQDTHSELSRINILSEGGRYYIGLPRTKDRNKQSRLTNQLY